MLVNLAARISLLKYLQCRVFTLDHSLSSEPSNKKDGACDQQAPEQNHTEQANLHHGHPSTIRESVHHLIGLFVLESPLSCSTTVLPLNRLFLTCGKDTPNTTKDRDMTFTSAARFLILDPAFLLRAVFSPCRSAARLLLRRPCPGSSLSWRGSCL